METVVIEGENGFVTQHNGTDLSKLDQAARIEYWQRQGTAMILNAAFELVENYCEQNGIDSKLDKTIERFGKRISDK